MDRGLIKYFWNCGDSQIIEFAMMRAHLNRKEKEVVELILDDCRTQEQAAEILDTSPRYIQTIWYSATRKLLSIDWVEAYAKHLKRKETE